MQIHGLQSASAAHSIQRTPATKPTSPVQGVQASQSPFTDQLDLSAEAQQLGQSQSVGSAQSTDGIRTEKVAALRQAIANGSYETPEKLSAALDKLLDTFA